MLKCEIGDGIDCKMMAAGSTMNLTDDVLNIIKYLYNTFLRKNPAQAKLFREALVTILQEPDSPIFNGNGQATVIDLSPFQGKTK